MIQIVEYQQIDKEKKYTPLKERFSPRMMLDSDLGEEVRIIIEEVRDKGDKALLEYTRIHDDKVLKNLKPVSYEYLRELHSKVDNDFLEAFREAVRNVRCFHKKQKRENYWEPGPHDSRLEMRYTPLSTVGLYIPGGIVPYPSSVIMTAVPAQVAGVNRILAVTPPRYFDDVPYVAAALYELNIKEVYTIGGPHAIAALAYGTKSIPRVDKIVGPGNKYVAEAKRQVFGVVDIDIIAGPSEIVVVADETANPAYVAADLLSQAEHGSKEELIWLLTTSKTIAIQVQKELKIQLKKLPNSNSEHAKKNLNANNNALVIVRNLDEVVEAVNRIAPEHLELMVKEPRTLCDKIKNAGAIFLGAYSPEPISDYYAGPNHVLPTSGTARYASPLGVYDFQKCTSIVEYTKEALEKCSDKVDILARSEGFEAHARAVNIRIK